VADLQGIAVFLRTSNVDDAGTDDHMYVGLIGRGGGREFPLATDSDEDFEHQPGGDPEVFRLGTIWEAIAAGKKPHQSEPGGHNDPGRFPLDMDLVDYVYLRKQGERSKDGDEGYALQDVVVILYGYASPHRRYFYTFITSLKPAMWLANENGHICYLREAKGG